MKCCPCLLFTLAFVSALQSGVMAGSSPINYAREANITLVGYYLITDLWTLFDGNPNTCIIAKIRSESDFVSVNVTLRNKTNITTIDISGYFCSRAIAVGTTPGLDDAREYCLSSRPYATCLCNQAVSIRNKLSSDTVILQWRHSLPCQIGSALPLIRICELSIRYESYSWSLRPRQMCNEDEYVCLAAHNNEVVADSKCQLPKPLPSRKSQKDYVNITRTIRCLSRECVRRCRYRMKFSSPNLHCIAAVLALFQQPRTNYSIYMCVIGEREFIARSKGISNVSMCVHRNRNLLTYGFLAFGNKCQMDVEITTNTTTVPSEVTSPTFFSRSTLRTSAVVTSNSTYDEVTSPKFFSTASDLPTSTVVTSNSIYNDPSYNTSHASEGASIGIPVGAAVAILIVITLISVGIALLRRRMRSRAARENKSEPTVVFDKHISGSECVLNISAAKAAVQHSECISADTEKKPL